MSKAQMSLAAVVVLHFFAPSVLAWGGLFNRFSPEMLSNLGYGGHGGYGRAQPFLQVSFFLFLKKISKAWFGRYLTK